MPVSGTSSSSDRNYLDALNGTSDTSGTTFNAVFKDNAEESIGYQDFFDLMIKQLQNQDFTNPVDDTQYLAQLAQIGSMEAMENLANYSEANYAMSFIGKTVTATTYKIGGESTSETGQVSQVSIRDGEYEVVVNGKSYKLDTVTAVTSNGETIIDDENIEDSTDDQTDTKTET